MSDNDRASAIASAILAFRRERSDLFPRDIFSEPAWDLLLDLFVADANGRRVTARQVGERSEIHPDVMSRWLRYLAGAGLVVGDGNGDIDDELTLSGKAFDSIEQMMTRAHAIKETVK